MIKYKEFYYNENFENFEKNIYVDITNKVISIFGKDIIKKVLYSIDFYDGLNENGKKNILKNILIENI